MWCPPFPFTIISKLDFTIILVLNAILSLVSHRLWLSPCLTKVFSVIFPSYSLITMSPVLELVQFLNTFIISNEFLTWQTNTLLMLRRCFNTSCMFQYDISFIFHVTCNYSCIHVNINPRCMKYLMLTPKCMKYLMLTWYKINFSQSYCHWSVFMNHDKNL